MMKDRIYVVIKDGKQGSTFWTGHGFSPEYPDALKMTEREALTTGQNLREHYPLDCNIRMVSNYGDNDNDFLKSPQPAPTARRRHRNQ